MKLKRLCELSSSDYRKIRGRQVRQRMKEYINDGGYLCYDVEEDDNFIKQKTGRKPKRRE